MKNAGKPVAKGYAESELRTLHHGVKLLLIPVFWLVLSASLFYRSDWLNWPNIYTATRLWQKGGPSRIQHLVKHMKMTHLLLFKLIFVSVVFPASVGLASDSFKNRQSAAAERFYQIVQQSVDSASLFDRMIRNDHEIYESLAQSSMTFNEAYTKKLKQIKARFAERDSGGPVLEIRVEPMDVATLLLLAILAEPPANKFTDFPVSLELYRGEIAEVLQENEIVAQLFNAWAISLDDDTTAWQAMRRASDLKLTQALPAAIVFAESERSSANLRSMAICLIGRVGGQENISMLIPFLEDARLPRDENKGFTDPMQVRDLALITMLQLEGQKPIDRGLVLKPMKDRFYTQFGFKSEADRPKIIESFELDIDRIGQGLDSTRH
ncbi:MAG: hypothetical protein AAGA96_08010 [Verrucomicrobiota bacterium]